MKTCEDFDIAPCVPCAFPQPETFIGGCWIKMYNDRFDGVNPAYARQLILNIIKDEIGLQNGLPYLKVALENFHPLYYKYLEKMLILA